MKKNVPAKTPPPAVKHHSPEIQRRINAGWLRLWKAVYPNTPPPQAPRSSRPKRQGSTVRRPAAVDFLSSFLALFVIGCQINPGNPFIPFPHPTKNTLARATSSAHSPTPLRATRAY
jgi:hypothetical protein